MPSNNVFLALTLYLFLHMRMFSATKSLSHKINTSETAHPQSLNKQQQPKKVKKKTKV